MNDMMSFPDSVEEFMNQYKVVDTEQVYTNGAELVPIFRMKQWFEHLPSAQPTLYGYSIEHLALIARVMQKENVTPEQAIKCFKDIQRIVQMVLDEQQEMIRKAVEE